MLSQNYAWKEQPLIRFAGQFSGVEGYMESAASGMVAALGLFCRIKDKPEPCFTGQTVLGALAAHVCTPTTNFQPMNANFGILEPLPQKVRGKRNRYEKLAENALAVLDKVILDNQL